MVQLAPMTALSLWFGFPGGHSLEKQWQEEHLAGDMVEIETSGLGKTVGHADSPQ